MKNSLKLIHFAVRSREVVANKPVVDMVIDELLDDGYDEFIITLQKLQLLVHSPGDRWMDKLEKGNSFAHILSATEATLDIRKAMVR